MSKSGTNKQIDQQPLQPGQDRSGLQIHTGKELESGSLHSQQLLGFHFGSPAEADESEPGTVHLAMQALTADSAFESWRVNEPVRHKHTGPLRVAESTHYTAIIVELEEETRPDLKALSLEAYEILLAALTSCQHQKLLRIWNYLDAINDSQDGEERYRLFSSGRAAAFKRFGIQDQATPVGTAIGTLGAGKLVLIALASDLPFQAIENPRQVSAYHYPVAYGPDSPKFSRAGLLEDPDGTLFLVSGTAAVVGHDSAFPFETARQLAETLTNLEVLTRTGTDHHNVRADFKYGPESVVRIYLREAEDYKLTAFALRESWGDLAPRLIFVQGAICRRELMIEMEAVFRL